MGCNLLQGLCTLFSNTSKPKPLFEKTAKQPFVDALDSVKKLLEASGEAEWKNLATRLEVASIGTSSDSFIYPISNRENDIKKNCYTEIYIRRSTLNEFNQACIDLLKTNMNQDQRDKVWDALLEGSKILHGDTPPADKTGIEQKKAPQSGQELAYKPL